MFGQTQFQVKGTLDGEGNPKVSVTAVKPYGPDGRTVSETVEVTDEAVVKAVASSLKASITDVREELDEKVMVQAAESYANASKRGEYQKATKPDAKKKA